MAQSLTNMITKTASTSTSTAEDSELLWLNQMIETIRNLKDKPSKDCVIIVDEVRIPVHKTVVQLNSAMLSSRSVRFDEHNEVTEIEVELAFDDHPDMVKDIITSFYSGKIEIDEEVIKEVYKFSAFYEIKWLKIHTSQLIFKYLIKSVYLFYERFIEIFSMAQFIWDTDLFEICIQVIDEETLELLIGDEEMLEKISYRCMEIITMSSNVGVPEKNLFDLLVAWATCKKQKHKKGFQQLFKNLRYQSMNKDFIIKRVMTYVSQNEGIFSVSFVTNIQDGMSESSKDMCRSERMKEITLRRVQIVIDNIESSDKSEEVKVNEVNSFLIRKDIRYIPDEMIEELADAIRRQGRSIIPSLDWLSVVNLINHHPTEHTADILVWYTSSKRDIALSEFYKLDWTRVSDKAISVVIKNERYLSTTAEIALSWCLANCSTAGAATLERIVSGICYKSYGDVYNCDILLPTIKHLLPNTTKLECQHSGECYSGLKWKRMTVNEKLYKLEPFKDDVATLTDKNGVLELRFEGDGEYDQVLMFKKDEPYEPFYPVYCEIVDDQTLRRFIATLKYDDKIVILQNKHDSYNYSPE